jgi:hypothetical protein
MAVLTVLVAAAPFALWPRPDQTTQEKLRSHPEGHE